MLRAFDESTNGIADQPTDVERRIEEWLVCYLDDQEPGNREISFLDLVEAGEAFKQKDQTQRRSVPSKRRAPQTRHWARVRLQRRRSIAVVKLLDENLIKAHVIEEVARELDDLLHAGYERILIDFAAVERMSSQILAVVADLHRRCAARPGGQLRLCGLRPEVAEVFNLGGLDHALSIHPDEKAALEGAPWPGVAGPRALPLTLLSELKAPAQPSARRDAATRPARSATGRPVVNLVVESGRHQGTVVSVRGPRFLIGRGPECRLRARNLLLSRYHAVIERRDGRALLRDLGSTNGTLVNGRLLRDAWIELADGDHVQFGPLRFIVTIDTGPSPVTRLDDLVTGWLADDDGDGQPVHDEAATTIEVESASPLLDDGVEHLPEFHLNYQVFPEVVLITPTVSRLDEGPLTDALRLGLAELARRELPNRHVLNLENVTHIDSRLIAVLLAHFLRLQRDGGAVRLCQLHARAFAMLEHYRLPMLLEAFSTVDEAVLTAWD